MKRFSAAALIFITFCGSAGPIVFCQITPPNHHLVVHFFKVYLLGERRSSSDLENVSIDYNTQNSSAQIIPELVASVNYVSSESLDRDRRDIKDGRNFLKILLGVGLVYGLFFWLVRE
jgi:hypothetical protein